MRRGSLNIMALIGTLACAAALARGEMLPEGWPWRRALTFRLAPCDAPGDNIAWAEFYTNGDRKADGSDLRITTADRVVIPHKILQVDAAGDLVRVAFVTKGEGPYFVWWGNAKAPAPAKDAEIRRGIFVEVTRHAGGAPANAFNAPPRPALASFIMPDVDLGYNPAGEERQVMLHYTGQFKIDRAITAQMAFTVSDSGLLTIDGKEVDRQIRTGLKSQVRTSVPVELATGWHTLDIEQVNQNQANVVMALAWQRPGEKAFTALPASIFAPAAHAVAGPLEKIGAPFATDIAVEANAESFFPPDHYAQRYTFEALFPASMKPAITWNFGDGQIYTGLKKVSHIFLSPGVYPVTATFSNGAAPIISTLRLIVRDRMYEKFPRPGEDNGATVRLVLKDYKPDKLPAEQAFRGMMLFEDGAAAGTFGDLDSQITWGKAWEAVKETSTALPDALVFDETFSLAWALEVRKDYKGAAQIYLQAAEKPVKMETRSNLMRLGVMTLCDQADDAGAGLQAAESWLKRISANNRAQVQAAQTALAYADIATGDGKNAKAAIDAAVAASTTAVPAARGGDAYNQQEIRQGVLTRNIENYLRTRDYDTATTLLNQWELENPAALWEGFTRTLRVKLAAAEGNSLLAARIALAHARANPDGFYAAELLFRAAENFKAAGDSARARTALDILAAKYPESPYARDAATQP